MATPQTERASWADLAAQASRQGEESAPEELRQLLAFEVAGAPYALPVECVREIVRLRSITPVPRTPAEVRGVISLRGEIVQVVDLRRRLGVAERSSGAARASWWCRRRTRASPGCWWTAVREVYAPWRRRTCCRRPRARAWCPRVPPRRDVRVADGPREGARFHAGN